MDDVVALAAMNNVLQSEAVLASLGSTGTFTDHFWSNDHGFDIPYANGATLSDGAAMGEHYAAIERLTENRPGDLPTYVMDSRAALDLTPMGFTIRIADEWFMRAEPFGPSASTSHVDIQSITTEAGIAEFERSSVIGFGGTLPEMPGHTYRASLLADGRFSFYSARVGSELAAGVFLFEDPKCTGVFTFFTLPAYRGRGLGSALLHHALSHAPAKPLATNPSPMSRRIFEALGFQPVGERRIWVRPVD